MKWFGTTGAAHAERAAGVHLADEPAADLDGLEAAAEGLGEGAFDQPLEPALEPLESHRVECTGGPVSASAGPPCVRSPERSEAGWYAAQRYHSGEWRNWQTRRIQVPVSERMWGFKSPLAHERGFPTELGRLRRQNSWRS